MEEVIVTAIVFGSLLAVIKMFFDYRTGKMQANAGSREDPGLKASELQALITEAVEDAIDERISKLERKLEKGERPRLQPASESKPPDVGLDHPAPPLVRRDRDITQ